MSSFTDLLRKARILKSDDSNESAAAPKQQQQTKAKAPQSISSSLGAPVTTTAPLQSGTDYKLMIREVLAKGNKPGADFYEFNNALQKMEGKPLTEQQKYETAFDAYQSMGVTADVLVNTGEYYQGLLDSTAKDFQQEWEAAQQKIEQKRQQQEALVQENARLSKQIEENNAKNAQLHQEILNDTNTLTTEKLCFESALNTELADTQSKITKIKTYLIQNHANTTK